MYINNLYRNRKVKRQFCKRCIAFMPRRVVKSNYYFTKDIKRLEEFVLSVFIVKDISRYYDYLLFML